MTYHLIYADPPWDFKVRSPKGEGRSAKRHYDVMTFKDILALPVEKLARKDSVLLMWATDPFLEKAFEVIHAWGYKYATVGFYWVKLNPNPGPDMFPRYFMGTGYYTRANPEQCLLATRGSGLLRMDKGVRKLIVSERREHSRKPDEVYERIDRLFGTAITKLELFARQRAPGWDVFGDEVEGSIDL